MMFNNTKPDKFKDFWQYKATRYPLPFEEETLKNTNRVIDIVKDKGVVIKDKRILDIGCGTGIYTLPLAKEAEKVTGLDFSDAMISRLENETTRHRINNVDVIVASWKELDINTIGFYKSFDIVWTSMSAAVRDEGDLLKMQDCSKQWCVYIGWGGKRENALMDEVFTHHNLRYEPPQGASQVIDILKGLGKSPFVEFIETSWNWKGTIDETVEDCARHIEVHGGVAKRDEIRKIVCLLCCNKDGIVQHTTHVRQGIVVWQV